jgi:enamine deaminase RidA (YjgF/YER057c/UK114 family)
VVAKGSMVFVRGQVGQELDTAVNVAIGDASGQTEQAMKNVRTLLAEAGAELGDICKITIYITDPRYREAVYRKIGEYLKGVYPVSTGIVVSALARPEWLVEVDVTAVIPDGR